jgi:hypothetical protein
MRFRVESSYDFEDKEKEFFEHLIVVAVDDKQGTQSIATFPLESKVDVENLIKHFNEAVS